jgi:hypothetical protein
LGFNLKSFIEDDDITRAIYGDVFLISDFSSFGEFDSFWEFSLVTSFGSFLDSPSYISFDSILDFCEIMSLGISYISISFTFFLIAIYFSFTS